MTMRFAIVVGTNSAVVGVGASESAAWDAATREAETAGISLDGATVVQYDETTHRIGERGGLAQIVER